MPNTIAMEGFFQGRLSLTDERPRSSLEVIVEFEECFSMVAPMPPENSIESVRGKFPGYRALAICP